MNFSRCSPLGLGLLIILGALALANPLHAQQARANAPANAASTTEDDSALEQVIILISE